MLDTAAAAQIEKENESGEVTVEITSHRETLSENGTNNFEKNAGVREGEEQQHQEQELREKVYLATGFGSRLFVPGCNGIVSICNVLVVLFMFAFFLFNLVEILKNYVRDRRNPPVNINVSINELVDFPPMLFCSSLDNVEFGDSEIILEYFNSTEFLITDDFAGALQSCSLFNETCLSRFDNSNKMKIQNLGFLEAIDGASNYCFSLSGIPGWSNTTIVTNFPNRLSFAVDLNFTVNESDPNQDYSSVTRNYVGLDGYIFENENDLSDTIVNFRNLGPILAVGQLTAAGSFVTKTQLTLSRLSYFEITEVSQFDLLSSSRYTLGTTTVPLTPSNLSTSILFMQYQDPRIIETRQKEVPFSVALSGIGGKL